MFGTGGRTWMTVLPLWRKPAVASVYPILPVSPYSQEMLLTFG